MDAQAWVEEFGPFEDDGRPIPVEQQPLTASLRQNRAGHSRHRIRSVTGGEYMIVVSGVPVIGADGFLGAMVFFWTVEDSP